MSKNSSEQERQARHAPIANLANCLTSVRLLLAPALGWALTQQLWSLGSLTIAIAVVTDVYDGRIARRHQYTSPFGGLFDHGTDAFFVSVGAWALATHGLVNPWLWPCIALAFLQYALDSNALAGRHLRTSILGRYNGVAYYALVATAVGSQAVGGSTQVLATEHPDMQAWLARGLVLLDRAVFWVAWLLVVSTVASMADRLCHSLMGSRQQSS